MKKFFAALAIVVALPATVSAQTQPSAEQALRDLITYIEGVIAGFTPPPPPPPPAPTAVEPANLQAALDAACTTPGTTIYLRSDAVYGATRVRCNDLRITTLGATGTGRVTAADEPGLAHFLPTGNLPALDITASNIVVDNIAISGQVDTHILVGHGDSTQTNAGQQPSNIVLSRLYMNGTAGAKRGIGLHGRIVTVQDSVIYGYRIAGQDTQAIAGWNGEGPFTIRNNYLEAAGENIMFGGADPHIPGLIPADILVEGNQIWKDPTWRSQTWTVKNLFELKAARRVIVRGNEFRYIWQGGQSGFAFQFTVQSQDGGNPNVIVEDVLVERNVILDVGCGINILGYAQINTSLQSRGFTFRDNWWQIDGVLWGCHGIYMQISREPRDIVIENETIQMNGQSGTNPNAKGNQIVSQTGNPVLGFRFVGNLVTRSGLYGFSGWDGSTTQHRAVAINTYYPGNIVTGNALGSFPTTANLPNNLHMSTSSLLPLVVDGYGTGAVETYGRRREQ